MVGRDTLKKIQIFHDFPEEYLDQLSKSLMEQIYDPGQIIFEEGSIGNALYIISTGSVEVKKITNKGKNNFKILALLEQGDYFGEMSLLNDKPRSASAYAKTSVELLILKREDFTELLTSSPRVAVDQLLGILRMLSNRLRQTSLELTTLYEIGRTISTLSSPEIICLVVLEKLYAAFNDKGMVWINLWNRFNEEYDIVELEGKPALSLGDTQWNNTHPLIMYAKEKNDGWLSNNLSDEKSAGGSLVSCGNIHKLLTVPLKDICGEFLGFLCAGRRKEEEKFNNSDLILLSAIGNFTATALMNASFLQEEKQRERLQRGKDQWH
ncbi:MAG: cyclic nucleotide-binding domain-containing protein [bacterium]